MTDYSKWVITHISVYNYSGSNKNLGGKITFKNTGNETTVETKLNEDDALKILEIFGDRLHQTFQEAAVSILEELHPVAQIEPPMNLYEKTIDTDEAPF